MNQSKEAAQWFDNHSDCYADTYHKEPATELIACLSKQKFLEYASELKEENERLREALENCDEYLSQTTYEQGKPVRHNNIGADSILHKQIQEALKGE